MAVLLVVGLTGCADQLTGTNQAETRTAPSDPVAQLAKDGEATAEVQIIHNADDPKARVVDVYVGQPNEDGEVEYMKALDNFKYRTATEFLELPTDVRVAVAPANSRSVDDAIATFFEGTTLNEGEKYIVVADGVLPGFTDKPPFEGNPEGLNIAFNLYPYTPARAEAAGDGVDLLAFHGATDAPTVDVAVQGGPTLVDDISYGSFQGYVEGVAPGEYVLDVTTADGSATVASFNANLSELGGSAITVVASGFLTPPPGPKFGLLAVTADGTVLELPRVDDEGDEDDGVTEYEAELEGENQVRDGEIVGVETDAEGEVEFKYIRAQNELRYKIELEEIEGATQAHIHLGGPSENGPVLAFLLQFTENINGSGDGEPLSTDDTFVKEGTITADDVIGPLDGDLESLIAEMNAGNTYVNVHTTENVPGEIRGQIELEDDGDDDEDDDDEDDDDEDDDDEDDDDEDDEGDYGDEG
jgi:hypothetical protein